MNSFVREYYLRQQSPLIHFQFDQEGATLRATEVKPKLDRFILNKIGGADAVKRNHKNWFMGDTTALNYKLRYSSPEYDKVDLGPKTDYDIYYGNMSREQDFNPVKAVKFKKDVKMTVICFDPELLQTIDGSISDFFLVTNFGRMQSKGFGSFTVGSSCPNESAVAAALKREYQASACYCFSAVKHPFKDIKTLYSIMKSGINFNGYRRSLLFLYMHSLGVGNEKAKLKQEGIAPIVSRYDRNNHDLNSGDQESYYVRALLGIGDHVEFLNDLNDRKNKTKIKISNAEIERYHSTIFFKIIGNRVYFVGMRINENIFGKTFSFSAGENNTIDISTPPYEQGKFDENFMDRFLEYAVRKINGDDLQSFFEREIVIQKVRNG